VEEHFWAKESLVTNVDVYHISIESLVDKFFKLVGLNHSAKVVSLLLVKGTKFFQNVLADVAVLLFDLRGDFV
jgi:hypothetical protein